MKKKLLPVLLLIAVVCSFVLFELMGPVPKTEAFRDAFSCVDWCYQRCGDGRDIEMAENCFIDCFEWNCRTLPGPFLPWPLI